MNRICAAIVLATALELSAAPIVWVKVTEPMTRVQWSQVDDIAFVDQECRSDNALPRVCLYRHLDRCRIITIDSPGKLPTRTIEQLYRMCEGYFPEPVLLRREFSNPNYLPNQAPPTVDPTWKFENGENR
jgi:hypothetical protein